MRLFAPAPRPKGPISPATGANEPTEPGHTEAFGVVTAVTIGLAATLALLACGGPETATPSEESVSAGAETTAPPAPLDWARLLPFNTQGLLRIDMAQLRRSSHYALISPALNELLQEESGGEGAAWEEMIARTDVVLVGIAPSDSESESTVLLAQGRYPADQIEQLQPTESTDERVDVDGVTVWVEPVGERAGLALIRSNTLVSGPLDEIRALLARTRMTDGERWPPAVRPLVADIDLEGSTIALVITERALDMGIPIRISAQAQIDERLVVEARLLLDDGPAAPMMRILVEGMLQGLAEQARNAGQPTLGRIDSLLQITQENGALVGRLETDAPTTAQLIAELVETMREDSAEAPAEAPPPSTGPTWPTRPSEMPNPG